MIARAHASDWDRLFLLALKNPTFSRPFAEWHLVTQQYGPIFFLGPLGFRVFEAASETEYQKVITALL